MRPIIFFLLPILVLAVISCASQRYVLTEDEEIYGSWAGEYAGAGVQVTEDPFPEVNKVDIYHGGECEMRKLNYPEYLGKVAYTLEAKRKADDGSILYHVIWSPYFDIGGNRHELAKFFVLAKVNMTYNTLEVTWDKNDYPSAIDPGNSIKYRIFQR